ncbi:unnamed protein product [Blepharisma stoltei]|uniref:Ankyrin repeat protein n=1 Tax=Blepharisma stoltei TaxID=1481888 RepID=A0AAU9K3X5_9CILI|nr:unnamed protein product [Blepharisma stoltei]
MSEPNQILPEEIAVAIQADNPALYEFKNEDDLNLKLMIIRRIVIFNKPKILSHLLEMDYFGFLLTSYANAFIFFIQQSMARNNVETCKILYEKFIKSDIQRENDTFLLASAIEKNQELANWIIDIDPVYKSYVAVNRLFQAGNAAAARLVIEKGANLDENSALEGNKNLKPLILEANLKNSSELIQICLDYKLMPKIKEAVFESLKEDEKLKLKLTYCYYYRVGLAYARYHVPFMMRLSNNLFGEIIDYI